MPYCSVSSTPEYFANCLTELPMQELLLLQHSLGQPITEAEIELQAETATVRATEHEPLTTELTAACHGSCDKPQRMALTAAADRGSYSHHYPHHQHQHWAATAWDEKPSKLQTLFQISITALAFLSFGGYLLCLIVQAIKSKGTTYYHPVATATTAAINGGVKRIKVYRRSRRYTPAHRDRHLYNNVYEYQPLALHLQAYV